MKPFFTLTFIITANVSRNVWCHRGVDINHEFSRFLQFVWLLCLYLYGRIVSLPPKLSDYSKSLRLALILVTIIHKYAQKSFLLTSLSLLTEPVRPRRLTRLVVTVMYGSQRQNASGDGASLCGAFSEATVSYRKMMWDVRGDSERLSSHFKFMYGFFLFFTLEYCQFFRGCTERTSCRTCQLSAHSHSHSRGQFV